MPNGPKPKEDIDALFEPFKDKTGIKVEVEVVGWDVQLDRIRNAAVSGEGPDVTQAGTTQVPFFAALGGFEDLTDRVEDIGGEAAYPDGVWATTQVEGQDGHLGRAVVHRGPRHLLPQGRPEEGGRGGGDARSPTGTRYRDAEAIKDKVPEIGGKPIEPFGSPGKKAFDLVHHVMPFVWDAGGAELAEDNAKSTIDAPEAQQGVEFFADLLSDGALRQEPARARRQAGGEPVQGRPPRRLDRRSVGARLGRRTDDENWVPAARENVGDRSDAGGPAG